MGAKAKLYLLDQELDILFFNSGLYVPTDYQGKPWGTPDGGMISVVIPSPPKTNAFLENLLDDRMVKGSIKFYKWDGIHPEAELEFANAYIVEYGKDFHNTSVNYYHMTLSISPGIQRYRGTIYERSWNPDNPFIADDTPVLTREDKEPRFLSITYFDENNNEINESRFTNTAKIKVATADIDEGESVEIILERENSKEMQQGKQNITFSGIVDDEGYATLEQLELKRDWELTNDENISNN